MGTNCASHVANIFLHVYEKTFISQLIEEDNNEHISTFGTIFRYQGDLISFGEHIMANNNLITNIYPKEMIIKNTNVSTNHATYLDLDISVIDNNYYFKSYDKRCSFNFPIIKYPNLRGNIPINAAYGVFTLQFNRFCTINLYVADFKADVRLLIYKLLKQGFLKNGLVNNYKQFARQYIIIWVHFGIDIANHNFISSIFKNIA